jgi:hypothetical protein
MGRWVTRVTNRYYHLQDIKLTVVMSKDNLNPNYPYGYGLSKILLFKIYLRKVSVTKWTLILSLGGFFLLGVSAILVKHFDITVTTTICARMFIAAGFFLWGCIGFLWAYRRQAMQVVMIRGKSAVFIGSNLMLMSWIMATYVLMLVLKDVYYAVMK